MEDSSHNARNLSHSYKKVAFTRSERSEPIPENPSDPTLAETDINTAGLSKVVFAATIRRPLAASVEIDSMSHMSSSIMAVHGWQGGQCDATVWARRRDGVARTRQFSETRLLRSKSEPKSRLVRARTTGMIETEKVTSACDDVIAPL